MSNSDGGIFLVPAQPPIFVSAYRYLRVVRVYFHLNAPSFPMVTIINRYAASHPRATL